MNKKKYLEMRQNLMNEAQVLLDNGDLEAFNAKTNEIEELDAKWEEIKTAQANFNALEERVRPVNISDLSGAAAGSTPIFNAGVPFASTVTDANDAIKNKTAEELLASKEYEEAWAKRVTGKAMNVMDLEVFAKVNKAYGMMNDAEEFTHTTENTPIMVPESVTSGIWREVGGRYPYFADVTKTYIPGKAVMLIGTSSSEAKWYLEPQRTEDGKEEFDRLELSGCELARAITVSWKLKKMAISAFIPYIIDRMAEEMGKAMAYGIMEGKGTVDRNRPEPLGVRTALLAEENTPHVTTYGADGPTYKDMITARSKVKSGYDPKLYVNANTMWTTLAAMTDANGRPLLMADAAAGGVYRVLGCVVEEDDSMKDGEMLFSDAKRGYTVNINENMSVITEDHAKDRETDYCAYAILDGTPMTNNAHSLLMKGE